MNKSVKIFGMVGGEWMEKILSTHKIVSGIPLPRLERKPFELPFQNGH